MFLVLILKSLNILFFKELICTIVVKKFYILRIRFEVSRFRLPSHKLEQTIVSQ